MQCSDEFYKECFMQQLQQQQQSQDKQAQSQKMLRILKQVEDDGLEMEEYLDAEEQEELSLEERIQGVDLDGDPEEIWAHLTEAEREEFHGAVKSGMVGGLVEPWKPWWTEQVHRLVSDVEETEEEENVFPTCPKLKKGILDLKKLIGNKPPSDTLRYNILSSLYAYAYIARLYNGDVDGVSEEATADLLEICAVLNENANYKSTSEALTACLNATSKKSSVSAGVDFSLSILTDIICIILGPRHDKPLFYMMAVFSHMYQLFFSARKLISSGDNDTQIQALRKKYLLIMKKLDFYLGWLQHDGLTMKALVAEIKVIYESAVFEREQWQKDKAKITKNMSKLKPKEQNEDKRLIEEL